MEATDRFETPRWRGRPIAARVLRSLLIAVPFVLVVVGAWWVNGLLGPAATLSEGIARWAALSVMSTIALTGVDRAAKQMLPLSTLLHLSITFPDAAPSRFKVALRRGSTRQLARDVATLNLDEATPQEAAEYLLTVVAKMSAHDRLTRGHTERVRAYADMVAEELDLSSEEREKLHWAGLIHDVGKLTVPADVLNKSSVLSSREWNRLKTHPNEGWKLVQPLRPWLGEWARATRDHHERWDGTGYPRGIKEHQISRAGRIISVVDAFDVMTTTRAYKKPMSFDAGRAELARCAGTHFDPDVVRAFLSLSLSKRRAGRAAWLANSPIALQIGSVAQAPAIATSALAAMVAAGTIVLPVIEPEHHELAAERAVVDVSTTLPEADALAITTAPPTTTTTLPATTTTPPTTTTTLPATTTAPPTTTTPPTTPTAAVVVAVTTTTNTTTTTTPPPTTSTLAPSIFDGGYLGSIPSGETWTLAAAVSASGPANPDSADNPDPGLTISPDAAGLSEISAPNVKAWAIPISTDLSINGHGTLRLYVAVADFDTDAFGAILGGLVDCASGITNCTTIGSGSAPFAQSSFGDDFGVVTIDLGTITHTVGAGHNLLVSLAVPGSIGTDIWVAFGTSSHPSRFRLT